VSLRLNGALAGHRTHNRDRASLFRILWVLDGPRRPAGVAIPLPDWMSARPRPSTSTPRIYSVAAIVEQPKLSDIWVMCLAGRGAGRTAGGFGNRENLLVLPPHR